MTRIHASRRQVVLLALMFPLLFALPMSAFSLSYANIPGDKWLLQLKDPVAAKRAEAAKELGPLRDKTAVEPLLVALKDEDPAVRAQAAASLGQIGDARAVPALLAAVKDEFILVRSSAITALGATHDPAAVDALIAIATDPKAELRKSAIEGLLKSRNFRGLFTVCRLLTDEDPLFVRSMWAFNRATAVARRTSDPHAVEFLLTLLTNPDAEIRAQAAYTLDGFTDPRVKDALRKLLADPAPGVRVAAVSTLGNLKDTDVADLLMPLLKDPDADVRGRAIAQISFRNDIRALPDIVAMAQDKNPRLRMYVATYIIKFHDPRATDVLLALLKDQNESVRYRATMSLGPLLTEPRIIEAAIAMLRDPSIQVRISTMEVLGTVNTEERVREVLAAQLQDGDILIRAAAAGALAGTNDPRVTKALCEMIATMRDGQSDLVTMTIGAARDSQCLPPLFAYVVKTTGDKRVRWTGLLADVIRKIGPPARDQLVAALSDQNPAIREVAIGVLGNLREFPWQCEQVLPWLEGSRPPIAFSVPWRTVRERLDDPHVVEPLIRMLEDTDQGLQAQAAEVIGLTGDARALGPLLALFKTDSPMLWQSAINGLGMLGDAQALEPLLAVANAQDASITMNALDAIAKLRDVRNPTPIFPLLRHPDWQVRSRAAEVLGLLGEEAAVEPLIDVLTTNTDANGGNRERTAFALGLLGDDRAVEPLITGLNDKVEWARSAAAWALGTIGDRRAVEQLVVALNPRDNRFQVRLATALIEMDDPHGWPALLAVMTHPDDMTRSIGTVALADHPDARAIDVILDAMKDENNWHGWEALQALAYIDDPCLVDALDEFAEESRDKRIPEHIEHIARMRQGEEVARDQLVTLLSGYADGKDEDFNDAIPLLLVLATIDDPAFTEPLAKLLTVKDSVVRVLAARVLALRKDPRGVPVLVAALKETRDGVARAAACKALIEIDPALARGAVTPEVAQAVLATLTTGVIEERAQVAEVAGLLRIPGTYDALLPLLEDRSSRLREAAARGVGALGDANAVPALLKTLEDTSSRVRLQTVIALGRLKDAQAVQPLIDRLAIENGTALQSALAAALRALTGQDFGTDAGKWRAWREGKGGRASGSG